MIRYGANPIAWSNDDDRSLGGEISLEQCLREAGEIGFDGIEKGHKFPQDPGSLRACLEPNGLAYVSGWTSLNLLVKPVDAVKAEIQPDLDLMNAMGCGVCIVAETSNSIQGDDTVALGARPVLSTDAFARWAEGVDAVGEHIRTNGLTMVYHHHVGTVVETPEEIDRLMAATGPTTRLLFDTGHCYFAGGDPATVLARHMDRVSHLHMKNVRADVMQDVKQNGLSFLEGVRRGVFTVPGDKSGAIDFPPILRIAADAGYQGWLVIEAEQDAAVYDPVTYQTLGLGALKRMAREVALDKSA